MYGRGKMDISLLEIVLLYSKKAVLFLKIVLPPVQCFLKRSVKMYWMYFFFIFFYSLKKNKTSHSVGLLQISQCAFVTIEILSVFFTTIESSGTFRRQVQDWEREKKLKSAIDMLFANGHWSRSSKKSRVTLHHITHGIIDHLSVQKNGNKKS